MSNPEEILNRSNCFKLFAACFYEPDKEMFLEEHVCDNLAALLKSLAPAAVISAQAMKAGLTNTSQERLSVDYAALFVGPFELIAAPYGSVYLEQNRRIMGDSTINIHRFYQDAGLTIEMKEPADHIAIELEFLYYLSAKEAAAITENDPDTAIRLRELQAQFFQTAMTWVPEFCQLIHAGAVTPYYRALAECLGLYHASCQQTYRSQQVS